MYEFIHYQVRDVMTSKLITVDQHATLAEVETLFEKHNFNGLPVVDKADRLIGMITKLDLIKAFDFTKEDKIPHYKTIMGQEIQTVMTKKLHLFYPETPLTKVLHQMILTRYKSLPVVADANCLVGIVSREDIVRALRQAAQGNLPARLVSVDAETLAEVSGF